MNIANTMPPKQNGEMIRLCHRCQTPLKASMEVEYSRFLNEFYCSFACAVDRYFEYMESTCVDIDNTMPEKTEINNEGFLFVQEVQSDEIKPMNENEFNAIHPIGTPVLYYPIAHTPEYVETVTRSEAWTLESGHVVVKIKGFAGGVSIDHILKISHESEA